MLDENMIQLLASMIAVLLGIVGWAQLKQRAANQKLQIEMAGLKVQSDNNARQDSNTKALIQVISELTSTQSKLMTSIHDLGKSLTESDLEITKNILSNRAIQEQTSKVLVQLNHQITSQTASKTELADIKQIISEQISQVRLTINELRQMVDKNHLTQIDEIANIGTATKSQLTLIVDSLSTLEVRIQKKQTDQLTINKSVPTESNESQGDEK